VIANRVILTLDDGPDPDYTPRILKILDKEKVPAAFFVVGMNALDHLPF
jgi:peptidoglycan/xylan/chitin deacetylase (PgdA/CDA1 family)